MQIILPPAEPFSVVYVTNTFLSICPIRMVHTLTEPSDSPIVSTGSWKVISTPVINIH